MMIRYDLCSRAVSRCRVQMKMANGMTREAWIERVMETRPGLNRAKVAKLVDAIFKAEN